MTSTAHVSNQRQTDRTLLPRGGLWMKSGERQPPDDERRRAARYQLWRWVAATPAVIGSLPLLGLASTALGRWSGLLLLAWAACAAAVITGVGERMTVRAAYGFRRPGARQAAALQPAWATALRVTGTEAGDVDLYVQMAGMPNAYAAGGRSVAVTTRVLQDYELGRLPEDLLVAVLVHELGHHAGGATRPMLLISWLAAPWRLTTRFLTGLANTLAGRQPRPRPAVAVFAGLVVAVTHALQQGQWMVVGVLAFVGLAAVLCPSVEASISRRSEFAADRFTADHGLALGLAAALRAMDDGQRGTCGWARRLLASHPTPDRRITALLAASAAGGTGGPQVEETTSRGGSDSGADRPWVKGGCITYSSNTPAHNRPGPT
ncbi:M48 family metalloprotease [Blastococcus sp. PRF04-17]|uniref:M48 family metalloprotease n=1 Tax=Blastococcus sp. PRF04-17 TaxID=2933797 RepID=UPI001FF25A22|nr:M48 family metalloprotease [Blastococcus sp. PRF04-17]UOY03172.1 M48 family metalloprotease [Blastococcus sp. PRF04-17]